MAFGIKLLPETVNSENELSGEITIGDFHERFASSTKIWSQNDYQKQWSSALKEVIEGQENSRSALISLAGDAQEGISITCWPLYREGDHVYVQNRLLFADDLPQSFRVEDIASYLGDHSKYSEDGDEISEWEVALTDIQEFYESIKD
jgi:hypothetical protein